MRKHLILLRGIPGSGKSTVAELLADMGVSPIYESREGYKFRGRPVSICTADDYFMVDGKYKFDGDKLGIAHKVCKNKCESAMKANDERVIVANTLTTEKEIKPYFELAEKYGYMVISLIVENYHGGKNVHNVPEKAIKKMIKRFLVKLY